MFLVAWSLCWYSSNAFTRQPVLQTRPLGTATGKIQYKSLAKTYLIIKRQTPLLLETSSDSNEVNSSPRRRRKRPKQTGEDGRLPKGSPEDTKPLETREDDAVRFQLQDIRDLVDGGKDQSPISGSSSSSLSAQSSQTSSSTARPLEQTKKTASKESLNFDSLETLLQDAKEMQALEKKDGDGVMESPGDNNEFSIPDVFRKILSTIVTVDFFVVCGFLLWFLLGIFCSYVLKNDVVQIAFNRKLNLLVFSSSSSSFFYRDY